MRKILLTDDEVEFVGTLFDGILDQTQLHLQKPCSVEEHLAHHLNRAIFRELKHKLETAEVVDE